MKKELDQKNEMMETQSTEMDAVIKDDAAIVYALKIYVKIKIYILYCLYYKNITKLH